MEGFFFLVGGEGSFNHLFFPSFIHSSYFLHSHKDIEQVHAKKIETVRHSSAAETHNALVVTRASLEHELQTKLDAVNVAHSDVCTHIHTHTLRHTQTHLYTHV